jgi:hypothetical protein
MMLWASTNLIEAMSFMGGNLDDYERELWAMIRSK